MALLDDIPKLAKYGEQPQPTGNGRIVLFEAIAYTNGHKYEWLRELLLARAVQGKEKYKTYLRAHNGRNALQDALDEALDGLMYATQENMQTPSYEAEELQRIFLEAAQLCRKIMSKRKPLTKTFSDLRAEFGDGWRDDNAD